MRHSIKTILIVIAAMAALTSCLDNDDNIKPSGDYSPIRDGFPQGNSEYDIIINDIKNEYGVYLLYKDVRETDMNREWVSSPTSGILVAGAEEEREKHGWDLPEEQLPYYVDFFRYYIFPNISKEFARTVFPVKIYMINNLRTEPIDTGGKEDNQQGTDTGKSKNIHIGKFDNWIISFPEDVVKGNGGEDAEYSLRQQRCIFMINVINNAIDRDLLVSPDEFWDDYKMGDNIYVKVQDKDKDAPNSLRNLGFVDAMQEKFGTGNSPEVIKPLPVESKDSLATSYWDKGKGNDLFKAYMMNAMWYTPEEFNARYETGKYTKIKEKYEFVTNYLKTTYGLDLIGISRGEKKENEEE